MSAVETPASADEINAETVERLEKRYQATLIPKSQLREEAPAFYSWLSEGLGWFTSTGQWKKYFLIFRKARDLEPIDTRGWQREIRYTIHFYTTEHRYQVSAIPAAHGDQGRLSASVSARKPLAGEEHHRGNDLSDGNYEERTWTMIQKDILNYELTKLECWL